MSSPGNSSGFLFVACLVSVLVLVVCCAGFLFPGRYQNDVEIPPTKVPESRQHITPVQYGKLAELRREHLAVIKAHLATQEGASALSEKPNADRADLREYTFTVEAQKDYNRIRLVVGFDVLRDSVVTLAWYDLQVDSPHYFIGVQSSQERMEQWIGELNRLLGEWDSAIEQTLLKHVEAKESEERN